MKELRNGLVCALLILICGFVVVLISAASHFSSLCDQAAEAVSAYKGTPAEIHKTLGQVSDAVELSRKTLEQEQGYYRDSASHVKALTKAAAIDAVELGRLIQKVNARVDDLADEAQSTVNQIGDTAEDLGSDSKRIADHSVPLLEAATDAARNAAGLAGNQNVNKILAETAQSSQNIQGATKNVEEATGYIRDMLSPKKQSFWIRIISLLIPRPTMPAR